jgi:hypothetical protein
MTLTQAQRTQIVDAIDSHIYWQLSEPLYRSSGAVLEPGSDDPDVAAEIVAFEALSDELENAGRVDVQSLAAIAACMSGKEWNAETLNAIAAELRAAGYVVDGIGA